MRGILGEKNEDPAPLPSNGVIVMITLRARNMEPGYCPSWSHLRTSSKNHDELHHTLVSHHALSAGDAGWQVPIFTSILPKDYVHILYSIASEIPTKIILSGIWIVSFIDGHGFLTFILSMLFLHLSSSLWNIQVISLKPRYSNGDAQFVVRSNNAAPELQWKHTHFNVIPWTITRVN